MCVERRVYLELVGRDFSVLAVVAVVGLLLVFVGCPTLVPRSRSLDFGTILLRTNLSFAATSFCSPAVSSLSSALELEFVREQHPSHTQRDDGLSVTLKLFDYNCKIMVESSERQNQTAIQKDRQYTLQEKEPGSVVNSKL